jgi:lysine/ornithine N-monooxygenase
MRENARAKIDRTFSIGIMPEQAQALFVEDIMREPHGVGARSSTTAARRCPK